MQEAPTMLTQCSADPRQSNFILIGSHPEPLPSKCPDHTPDNLKRVFLQSANALKGGDPDASGTMSRKVIDVSTQSIFGDEAKNYPSIYSRIEALAARGALTPDLKEWAHQVRLGVGDAANELDPFTQEEADCLILQSRI
jgi:hypothetical protein